MTSTPDIKEILDAAVAALGGARREGQERMAEAVGEALNNGRHLAVQAGTGTGKSLAYLVPAILRARAVNSTVIISTATLALQRQLIHRDLPLLVDAIEPLLNQRPTFATFKGRNNYLCLNRLATTPEEGSVLMPESQISSLGAQVKIIHEWAQETTTGDRDELDSGVSDQAWRQFSVTAQECVGSALCPHSAECFANLARAQAEDVDIVVTNHALLAIDALSEAAVLPEHEAVIIDEAHELDERITAVATNEISARSLRLTANRAAKLGAESSAETIESLADDFAAHTAFMEPGRWTSIDLDTHGMLSTLLESIWAMRMGVAEAPANEESSDPEKHAERHNLINHLEEMHQWLSRMLAVFDSESPGKSDEDVVWIARHRDMDTLAVAPLSIAPLLSESLFAEHTVVLTSATLTLGGSFDAMANSWGLPPGTWDALDVGTPFNPRRAGILYTAAHLPPPGGQWPSPEAIEVMYELIMAAGGRTLGLFSSRRAAEQAAEALRPRLPFDVLLQGEGTLGSLVDAFSRHENTCLFGTLSLWQGVDVPGRSLSLVIMDRIPFPRPDDPLVQARSEAADAAGRRGFMEVSATHAALLMAQGAGRLLRKIDDRGVVAVLDSRLVSRRYGKFLRSSLPAFWPTIEKEVVIGALKRLVSSD